MSILAILFLSISLFLGCGSETISSNIENSSESSSGNSSQTMGSSSSFSSGENGSSVENSSSSQENVALLGSWQSPIPVNWWDDPDQDGVYPWYELNFSTTSSSWNKGRYTLNQQTESWDETAPVLYGADVFQWSEPVSGLILYNVESTGENLFVETGAWKYEILGDTLKLLPVRAFTGTANTLEGAWQSRVKWWDGTTVQTSKYVETFGSDGWLHKNLPSETLLPAENVPSDIWQPYTTSDTLLNLVGVGDADVDLGEYTDPDGKFHYHIAVSDESYRYEIVSGYFLRWSVAEKPLILIRN